MEGGGRRGGGREGGMEGDSREEASVIVCSMYVASCTYVPVSLWVLHSLSPLSTGS